MDDFYTQQPTFMHHHPLVQRSASNLRDYNEYESIEKAKQVVLVTDDESNTIVEVEEVVGPSNGGKTTIRGKKIVVGLKQESKEEQEQEGEGVGVGKEDVGLVQRAKKVGVAVSGGALIVVGIPMIPLPGTLYNIPHDIIMFEPILWGRK